MADNPRWISLADAVARLELVVDADPIETLHRFIRDGKITSRGWVGGEIRALAPNWWREGAVRVAENRIVGRAPERRRRALRAESDPGDPLGPGDWEEYWTHESAAEDVQIDATALARALGGVPTPPHPAAPGRRYAPARLAAWYAEWVAAREADGRVPSRDDDWAAAKQALGADVPREAVRALRRRLAPAHWRRGGRPRAGRDKGGTP